MECDKFYLKPINVREVRSVVFRAAGVRVGLVEEQRPTVSESFSDQLVNFYSGPGVKCQVVQSGTETIVNIARECWRLFDNDVGVAHLPASSVIPTLEEHITQVFQEPAKADCGFSESGDPKLDVMDLSALHQFDCMRGSQIRTGTSIRLAKSDSTGRLKRM